MQSQVVEVDPGLTVRPHEAPTPGGTLAVDIKKQVRLFPKPPICYGNKKQK